MGCETIVYGFIEGAIGGPDRDQRRLLQRINRRVIGELPRDDEWPWLTRHMFLVPGEKRSAGMYRNQAIHFGASYKEVELGWATWIAKFEALLRRLFWFSAAVHMRTDWGGRFKYEWEVEPEDVHGFVSDPPRPPSRWRFKPGPMLFVPYGVDPADPNAPR